MKARIYTDGSCLEGGGGWSCVLCLPFGNTRYSGICAASSSNYAELFAIAVALEICIDKGLYDIEILSDSAYCVNNIRYGMPEKWEKNCWKTREGHIVKNMRLWERYLQASRTLNQHEAQVQVTKVKSHRGNTFNEIADACAKQACTQNKK